MKVLPFLATVLVTLNIPLAAAPQAKNSDAARVAIIRYDDKTGTQNFEYMPGSLQEAITKSMQKKFEFIEVDAAKVEPIAAKIRKANNGQIGPKEAAEICRRADIDILIYGNFTFSEVKKTIEINTQISLGSTDKYRTTRPIQNRVDATIFSAADKVAGDIVSEITLVAKEQQATKGIDAAKNKQGKTQLDKTEKTKTWADVKWNFTAAAGVNFPLVSQDNAIVHPEPTPALSAMYRFKNAWHIGGAIRVINMRSEQSNNIQGNTYRTNITVASPLAMAGYYFDLSPRWRATTEAGLGYYFGEFKVYRDCKSSNCNNTFANEVPETFIYNPTAVLGAGIHFLAFSFMSIGLDVKYQMLYDSKPLHNASALLALSVVF